MNKLYYLPTCNTCRKILQSLPDNHNLVLRDIKQSPINSAELDEMCQLAGSYQALFSKRAQLYKTRDLKNKTLTEADYQMLILEHYTFLSRPVFVVGGAIYIGSSQQTLQKVQKAITNV